MKIALKIILKYNACIAVLFCAFTASVYFQNNLLWEFLAVSVYIPALSAIPLVFSPIAAYFMEKKCLLAPKELLYISLLNFLITLSLFCIPTLPFFSQYDTKQCVLLIILPSIAAAIVFYLGTILVYWFHDETQPISSVSKVIFSILQYTAIILCILLGEPVYDHLFSNDISYLYWIFRGFLFILHPVLITPVFGYKAFCKNKVTSEQIVLFSAFFGICSFFALAVPNICSVFKIPVLALILWAAISASIFGICAFFTNRAKHKTF